MRTNQFILHGQWSSSLSRVSERHPRHVSGLKSEQALQTPLGAPAQPCLRLATDPRPSCGTNMLKSTRSILRQREALAHR